MTTPRSDELPDKKTGRRLITRRNITANDGIPTTTIRRREAKGTLTPVFVDGVRHYEIHEVLRAFATHQHAPSKPGGCSYEDNLSATVLTRCVQKIGAIPGARRESEAPP